MIQVHCFRCDKELQDLGGLLFSPPLGLDQVKKLHVCIDCYDAIVYDFPITSETNGENKK